MAGLPDAKMKKAEPSSLLSIDSPMVIFFTDLETLGIGGGGGGGGGGGPAGGGEAQGGGGSPVEPAGGGEPPPTATTQYVAMCQEPHEAAPSVSAEGIWFGTTFDRYEDAQAEASAHEHASAYVSIYANGLLIGPVS
jgi:hypothetical protein